MQPLRKAKDLLEAIQSENLSATRHLLIQGANPNLIVPDDGITAFHLAVGIECTDALDFVKLMLQYGGSPNIRSTEGMTPTLIAAAYGRYQALCLLLDSGGDPTIRDDSGKNALEYARSTDSWDCVNLLKEPWERQMNAMASSEFDETSSSNHQMMDSEEASSLFSLPEKVISETYLASKQGFDVTSPDNPLWFFKGSPGSTVIECSGLDHTVMYSARSNMSNTTMESAPSNPSNASRTFLTCHDSILDKKRLSFNDSVSTSGRSSPIPDISSASSRDTSSAMNSTSCSYIPSTNTSLASTVNSTSCSYIPSTNTSLASIDSSTLSQIVDEHSMSFMHKDTESDTVLIERQCPSASTLGLDASHLSSVDYSLADSTIIYDWQQYRSVNTSTSESYHEPVRIPDDLLQLTDVEIRQELSEYGYNVGPITATTRKVYLQRLYKLQTDPASVEQPAAHSVQTQGFRFELSSYVHGNFTLPQDIDNLEQELISDFQKPDKTWREGKLKSSFNYLLLDPRVTNNLPLRYPQMTELEVFTVFVSGIFYVGKGKRNRPYAHFNEALHHMRPDTEKQPGAKVSHILDIWAEGHGVVSLHCFQNVIPVEAYTREACMMHAIGLQRLTNAIKGNFYGTAQTWSASKQRVLGIYLLKKACQIFLIEGERQIRPGDIVVGQ